MQLKDFNRLINFVKKKIYLLIGRAILTAVNNDEKTQKVQVTALKDETISDIERMQEYGFETYPKTGTAEAVVLFQNGNRDQGLVVCVHDKDKRPTDLTEGNVRMYDWNNNKITLTNDGITIEDKNSNKIEMKSGEINITGTKINLLNASEAFINGTTFDAWMTATLKTTFDAHVHGGILAGGAVTLTTATPLILPTGHLSATIKGS